MKLISETIYVRLNNFAQCGLKAADCFTCHKHHSKYISRALDVSFESLFPHGRTSPKAQQRGWVSRAPYSYCCWNMCIMQLFLQYAVRWVPETIAPQDLGILQLCRILPSVTSWPTSLTEAPTRGCNRAPHCSVTCRFYEKQMLYHIQLCKLAIMPPCTQLQMSSESQWRIMGYKG